MEDDVKTIGDYVSIAWRRKFHIVIPFVLVLVVTILTVLLLPPVYKSMGTILIESQQVPKEFIQSAVTSLADERIQVIKQRIMTSAQMFDVIKKFDLYKDELNSKPRSEILEEMRNRVSIDLVSAAQKKGRRGASAVIAFTIAFEHESAWKAQKVANELVTLFLDENIKSRTDRAAETTRFLKKQGDRLKSEIEVMEGQVAEFKQENADTLPQNLSINLNRLDELKMRLFDTERELNALNEKEETLLIELEALGSQRIQASAVSGLGETDTDLRSMQNEFVDLSAKYGEEHPDVKAMKRKIKAFEEEYGVLGDNKELQGQIDKVNSELSALTQKYSPEHPDVKRLRRKVNSLKEVLAAPNESGKIPNIRKSQEYLHAKVKLDSVGNSINSMKLSRLDLGEQISKLNFFVIQTPQVEKGLEALKRDLNNTKRKYEEIKSKQLEAELSMSLEEEQKGERFTLLEPPLLPDKPVKPDRLKVFLIGLILSIVCGVGVAGLAEAIDGGIRGVRALTAVTKFPPLVAIPYITTQHDEAIRKRNLKLIVIVIVILGLCFVAAIHVLYKPLDLLWYIILRKLNLT